MSNSFDIVVIGSGPGGYVAAIHAAQAGFKTAIIEKEPTKRLGGTCLLRGCIPTKAMLHTADVIHEMRECESIGIKPVEAKLDMDMMHQYRDRVIKKNSGGVSYLMKKNKVEVIFGHARITGKGSIEVTDADGKKSSIKTKTCILATGSKCAAIPGLDVDHERVLNSDDILSSKVLPKHLVVVGAGAVGTEFASVYLRYGSKITLIELQDRVLPLEDREVSAAAKKSFEKQGMKVLLKSKVTKLDKSGDGVKVTVDVDGKSETIDASHVLVAVGRAPVTNDCGLDKTKIKPNKRGFIEVDDNMKTAEDWIYAIGDIVPTQQLAHLANREAAQAVDAIAGKNPRPINYRLVPNCTYSFPEVSSVGYTEEAAKEAGYELKIGVFPFSANGKAAILNQTDGFVKLIFDKKYDELLGMHIIGPKATELVTEATLGMTIECTLDELLATIHPHPTINEAIGEAAHAASGFPVHI